MIMRKVLYLTMILSLTICVSNTFAQNTNTNSNTNSNNSNSNSNSSSKKNSDSKFMMELATGGMNEIGLSQTALARSSNEEVKQFAQKMVDDHTAAGEELKSLATDKNVTLPTTMDSKHMSLNTKLTNMTGMDFDKEYMKAMVKDHEATISLLAKEANSGKDADAKALASKLLPIVQGHLQMARTIMDNMSGKNNSNKQ